MISKDVLERSGIIFTGRSNHLGALYDFRTDSFQGGSLFSSELDSEEDIELAEDLNTRTVELKVSESLEDKFHLLDIEAELSASILSGLVKVSGSGKLIEEKRMASKSSSMSLIYKVETVHEEIDVKELRKKVDNNALNTIEATHVLTGIIWGAVYTVTARYTFNDSDEKMKLEDALREELNKLKEALEVPCETIADQSKEQFEFFTECDLGSNGHDHPVTLQNAFQQAKSLPELVKATTEEKGVPLKYVFMPLSVAKKKLRQKNPTTIQCQEVDESTLKRVVTLVEQISDTKQEIEEFRNVLHDGKEYILHKELDDLNDLLNVYVDRERKFLEKLQVLLKSVRSGEADSSEMDAMMDKFESGDISANEVAQNLAKKEPLIQKIKDMKKLTQSGIRYFGCTEIIGDLTTKNKVYVLYLGKGYRTTTSTNILLRLKVSFKKNTDIQFYVKDCSVVSKGIKEVLLNKICLYKKGELRPGDEDVAAKYCQDTESCLVKFTSSKQYNRLSSDRGDLVLGCPLSFCIPQTNDPVLCSNKPKEWKCSKCKNVIQYSVKESLFYCLTCTVKCDPQNTEYRCDEDVHGIQFGKYDNENLTTELGKIKAPKKINILILGETGVGKSTWINSFANYIQFDSLKSAVEEGKGNPIVAIPSKFTYTKDGNTQDILIGKEDPNEVHDVGVSNTQGAKTYPFTVGDAVVNLIDTPGIGDTRGSKQDDANMDMILAHLTYYEELHGIIMLLKPNNARLGIMFKHCIQQLLTHLHKNAASNISFVFTNTRATFYEPGETLPALRKLLKDKNMGIEAVQKNTFCFDNEAFRLLACILNGIKFEDDVMTIYEGSWKRACDETNRLLDHIIHDKKPHVVKDTTSLNDARRIIVGLSRPLQEFTTTIKTNEQNVKAYLNDIVAIGSEAKTFEDKLEFEGTTLERHELDYPRTVCTHQDCVEYIPVGKDLVKQPNYTKHCHAWCSLGGSVSPEVIGDARLTGCAAFTANVCNLCGHHYTVHMHRTYDLHQVKKKFISEEVKQKLDHKLSEKEKKEAQMTNLKQLGEEFKDEGNKIQKVAAGFAAFLKIYAIIPFNDAMGDYIDIQIEEEKKKVDLDGKQKARIAEWTTYKNAYEEQKGALIDAMRGIPATDEGNAGAAEDIKDLMQEAFQLKHFGKDIEKVYKKIEEQKSKMPVYSQGPVHHLNPNRSKIKHISPPSTSTWAEAVKETGRQVKEAGKSVLRQLNPFGSVPITDQILEDY